MNPQNSNKILIYIPSKGRADLFFQKGTFRWMKEISGQVDYIVTLEKEDVPNYLRYFPGLNVLKLPESNQGLSYAHSRVKDYAITHGYNFIFKHDDDITTWATIERRRSIKTASPEFLRVLQDCGNFFSQYPSLDGIGFNYDNEFRNIRPIDRLGARFQTNYIVRTNSFYFDTRVRAFEDFYASAMIIKNGGRTIRYGLSAFATADPTRNIGENKGGLQLFDRRALAEKDLEVFKEKGIYKGYKTKNVVPFIEPIF